MLKKAFVSTLGLLLLVSAPVLAGPSETPNFARSGPYLGLGFIYAFEQFDLKGARSQWGPVDDSLGVSGRAGYRLRPHFGAELSFEQYDGFELDRGAKLKSFLFTVNTKWYALTGRIQPYALVGFGLIDSNFNTPSGSIGDTDAAGRFGAGIDVYLTNHVLVGFESSYVLPTTNQTDNAFLPVVANIQYKFDNLPSLEQ